MRDAIVAEARTWLGTPFRWQASAKGVGCDCLGFVGGVARAMGIAAAFRTDYRPPIDGRELRRGLGDHLDQTEEARPGDVLLLKVAGKPQHLAIYAGAGRMIHTYSKGPARVIEVPMGRSWWRAVDSIWSWRGIE